MTTIQIRIDDETKNAAKKVLDDVGLDLSTAIKLYLKKIALVKGIPFTIITENGMTLQQEMEILKAVKEAEMGINVTGPMEGTEAIEFLRNRSKRQRSNSNRKKK